MGMSLAFLASFAAATTDMSWDDYKQTFGKVYNGEDEDVHRANIYNANMVKYAKYNADVNNTAVLGANQFSDLSLEEFKALHVRGYKKPEHAAPLLKVHKYNAIGGYCQQDFNPAIPQGSVTGLTDVDQSVEALKSALNLGPVSVGIEADQDVFQGYIGGVITYGCGSNVDHGVTAVGYTSDYFIVKNSWGASWGEEGYVNIAGDQCGITTGAVFPLVSPSPSPTPTPSPSPSPTPSPSPCHDNEDADYCADLVQQDLCDFIGYDCLKTCGCCDDPTLCGGAVLV